MKRWKLLAITFLCAAVSMGGWWSSYPGPSPHSIPDIDLQAQYSGVGQCPNGFWVNGLNHDAPPTCSQVDFEQIIGEISSNQIPPGIVLQQPIINGPTINGTTTFGPGSIVNYDPTTVINGPNGSVWNSTGISNLANLTISPTGSLTFPDGSTWTAAGIANSSAQGLVITAPVGIHGNVNVSGNIDGTGVVSAPSVNANDITLSGPGGNWTFGYNGTSTAQINWPPNGSVFITQVSPSGYLIAGGGSNPLSLLLGPPQRVEIGTNWALRVVGGIAEPPSALPGSFYYNQTGNYMEYWNGTTWVSLAGLTGGACAAGDFVNSISSAGVITCGTPSGGGGSLPTPVSIGNGGLGQGVAPNPGQILVASGPTAYNPVTMTGDVTISPTGVTTVTSPVIVSGSAPPSPRDAQLWFNTTDLQTYIWYNDGTSSQWVPVVNLIGGGFLPINNPTFTGTLSGPLALLSGLVVIDPADTSTQVALNGGNVLATGAGQFGGTVIAAPAILPQDVPTLGQVQALIAAGGGNFLPLTGGTLTGPLVINLGVSFATALTVGGGGIQWTFGGAAFPTPDALSFRFDPTQTARGRIAYAVNGGPGYTWLANSDDLAGYLPVNNPLFTGLMTGPSELLTATNGPGLSLGSSVAAATGTLYSIGTTAVGLSYGSSYNAGLIATQTAASGVLMQGNLMQFFAVGNLVPGTGFAAPNFASLNGAVNTAAPNSALFNLVLTAPNATTGGSVGNLLSATASLNASAQVAVNNATNGANSVSILRLITDASNGWIMNTSTGFTGSGPNVPGNVLQIGNTGAGGMVIATNASIGPPAPQIKIWAGPSEVGTFADDSVLVGLALPGFGSVYGGGNAGATGLAVGNGYISGTAFASIALSGASHTNTANTAWIADGGCGSGCGLFQMSQEIGLAYYTGPIASGTAIPWVASWGWNQYTLAVQHMGNLENSPAPTVSNGSLMSGSRDSAGYILPTAWPVQLNFGRPWANAPVCVAIGAAGVAGVLYTNAQNANNIQFGCVEYGGGPVCAPQWFTYICMDVNAGL